LYSEYIHSFQISTYEKSGLKIEKLWTFSDQS